MIDAHPPNAACRRLALAFVLCALLATFATASRAWAASPGPAWAVTVAPFPTNFTPGTEFGANGAGPGYIVSATNVGAAPTSDTFTIRDTLPAGLEPASSKAPFGKYGAGNRRDEESNELILSCTTAGQVITCTVAAPAIRPGEGLFLVVPVAVAAQAPAVVTNTATVEGGGAPAVTTTVPTRLTQLDSPFGLAPGRAGLFTLANNADGTATTQAGSHPYQLSVGLGFTTYNNAATPVETRGTGGGVRDFTTVLPPGLVVNPQATPVKCAETQLEASALEPTCPPASQVGTVDVSISFGGAPARGYRALYNMAAPHGTAAELAFEVLEGAYIHLEGGVRNDGRYQLAAEANDIPAKVTVVGGVVHLWGEPSDPSHDGVRGECLTAFSPTATCPVNASDHAAFLAMPSACSGPLVTSAEADSWIDPTPGLARASFASTDANGMPVGVGGCAGLQFNPSMSITPDVSTSDSPTGLSVVIRVPQNDQYENAAGVEQLATANLKDVHVTLPQGVTVNPSAADGLGACSETQIGYNAATGGFGEGRPLCPDASKVGTVEVDTPLLDHTLPGAVYLATPFQNPFSSLLALYVVIDDPQSGIVIKLPGHVVPDPATGQLSTTFDENPQLPFGELRLHFFGGPRASLASPESCGTYASQAHLGPWSGTPPVALSSPFVVDQGPHGGGCTSLGNRPSFAAGTTSQQAGAYAPFVLNLRRDDGSQRILRLNTKLPPGLTGKLAGIPYCPESAIAAAGAKPGRAELDSSSCPAASEVGTVTVGAGVGPSPYFVGGKAYLAGPYRGAPLSLAIVTPAVAGPFDLGTVVVRAALFVDLETAEISVESDPLPTILKGIPLDVRSISVDMSRPNFTLNPTNCEPSAVAADAISTSGDMARLSSPFQVGNCSALGFKPRLKLRLKGATKRTGHPALKAVVTYPKQGAFANIARAQVGLPHSAFLDQGNLDKVCRQAELRSGTCPKRSIYGRAKAWTPLLDKPLEGPVYLGVGFGYKLPALVADLNGQVRILLKGRVDTTKHEGIRNTFEAVPDAPVSRFVLEMKGGKKYGLLENSENICRKTQRASARFVAQNGRIKQLHPKIANSCSKQRRKHTRKHHHKSRGKKHHSIRHR